ncbi:hypothetical protein [Phenylobacterium sp.]|uniref:hypothetical protein n=1 Tax=Phenylobacterium sp. TaxID=1871053 RepID=UPI003568FC28
MFWFSIGLLAIVALCPVAVSAIRFAKRQRGGAVVLTSLMLMFGMNTQITPPPPPQIEMVQRQAPDDEPNV